MSNTGKSYERSVKITVIIALQIFISMLSYMVGFQYAAERGFALENPCLDKPREHFERTVINGKLVSYAEWANSTKIIPH
jgi:hypothetical protein